MFISVYLMFNSGFLVRSRRCLNQISKLKIKYNHTEILY